MKDYYCIVNFCDSSVSGKFTKAETVDGLDGYICVWFEKDLRIVAPRECVIFGNEELTKFFGPPKHGNTFL